MADYLEKEWAEIKEEKKENIEINTNILLNLDIVKLQESRRTKVTKPKGPKFNCTKCQYMSVFQYQMKVHMYSFHKIDNLNKTLKKSTSSHGSVKRPRSCLKVSKKVEVKPTDDEEEQKEVFIADGVFIEAETSPVKKKSKENEPTNNVINIEPENDEVANEVSQLVENLEDKVRTKEEKIRFILSEKELLENKVKSMRAAHETTLESAQKIEQDKQLLQIEYGKCLKANSLEARESEKAKKDYKECAQQLNFAQRKIEELSEKLKVTEAILQSQEEDDDDRDEDDEDDEDEEDEDDAAKLQNEDDDDYLEDEEQPGQLWQVVQKEKHM